MLSLGRRWELSWSRNERASAENGVFIRCVDDGGPWLILKASRKTENYLSGNAIQDYSAAVTSASLSVLLEVMTLLAAYRNSLVLVGGWVPYFLLREHGSPTFQHAGSIDVDLLVDPAAVDSARYATMLQLLQERGYVSDPQIRYRLNRSSAGVAIPIGGDFLTPQPPPGQGKSHRHRSVQHDLDARVVPFGEIGFKHWVPLHLEGELPDNGGKTRVDIRMSHFPHIAGAISPNYRASFF